MQMDPDRHTSQLARGLPSKPLFGRRLMYAAKPDTLVLSFVEKREGHGVPQLYVRRPDEQRYWDVSLALGEIKVGTNEAICLSSAVLGQRDLFCVASVLNVSQPQSASGRDIGILRVNLSARCGEVWPITGGEQGTATIAELVGIDDDDSILAVAGFVEAQAVGEEGYRLRYELARLEWTTRSVSRLSPMVEVFF